MLPYGTALCEEDGKTSPQIIIRKGRSSSLFAIRLVAGSNPAGPKCFFFLWLPLVDIFIRLQSKFTNRRKISNGTKSNLPFIATMELSKERSYNRDNIQLDLDGCQREINPMMIGERKNNPVTGVGVFRCFPGFRTAHCPSIYAVC